MKFNTLLLLTLVIVATCSCKEKDLPQITPDNQRILSKEFRKYWYASSAEINSYQLTQERYGNIHRGEAVLIFVTENFLNDIQVKADNKSEDNVPVLKLNSTKSFNTGIYPYSVMQSTFYPVKTISPGLKVTSSVQEWCGQTYTQLNNRSSFQIESHSYFQGEADQMISLDKSVLENSIWTQIRINPEELLVGDFQAIPDFSYLQMYHKSMKSYQVKATITTDSLSHYTMTYPELRRQITIDFIPSMPFEIVGWTETQLDKNLSTTAKRTAVMQLPYWQLNKPKDVIYRDSLKLK